MVRGAKKIRLIIKESLFQEFRPGKLKTWRPEDGFIFFMFMFIYIYCLFVFMFIKCIYFVKPLTYLLCLASLIVIAKNKNLK